MSTHIVLLVIDELGIRFFGPASRRSIDLVRKGAHSNRDSHALDVKEAELVFPIQARGRDCRLRQPVHRDVVEDVITRKACGLSGKDRRNQLVTVLIVIQNPGGQTDR